MAVESLHWTQRLTWITLHFRTPAIRVCGDLRSAIAKSALFFGCYNLLLGSLYLNSTSSWLRYRIDSIVVTSSSVAIIIAAMNALLYYACKMQKNDKFLKNVLCAAMALSLLDLPLSVATYISSLMITPQYILPLWLTIQIAFGTLHLFLMYCLLLELRGEDCSSLGPLFRFDGQGEVVCNDFPKKGQAESSIPITV